MEEKNDKTLGQAPERVTRAYACYERYHEHFYVNSNLEKVLKQCRDFYDGRQYRFETMNDMPKPVFNICREGVDKLSAKVLETEFTVSFIADDDKIDLTMLDNFYDYQMKVVDNAETVSRIGKNGFRDGEAVAVVAFDSDTLGTESKFRGFIKRQIIPFEQLFFDNPYCEDIQDQRYWGYTYPMEIKAVKDIIEGDEKRKEELSKLIKPEDFYGNSALYARMTDEDIDSEIVPVYVRFFRVDGEVMFELSTKWVDIYEFPHALNPKVNESIGRELKKRYDEKSRKEEDVRGDYDIDPAKYVIFQKAMETSSKEHKKSKGKFYLYPAASYRPYPIDNSILGTSAIQLMIANQKLINLIFLYVSLIMQYHAMPKWIAKPDALKGQKIDNSANQVIYDYTSVSSGVQWGIQRAGSADAVNSNLISIGSSIINLTQNINGFSDLVSDNQQDMSGYAYQQVVHQSNLTLQQPQKRLWRFIRDIAKIDMLYFKHYVDEAKFYVRKSDAQVNMENSYRGMSQNIVNAGYDPNIKPGTPLPEVKSTQVYDVKGDMFDCDFDVVIDVEQGIASSTISEAEQYNNIWQYIFPANVDMDKVKVYMAGNPSISKKTRQKVYQAIEATETDQIAIKNQQIQELTKQVEQMSKYLDTAKQNIEYLNKRDQARTKAFSDVTKEQQAMVKMINDKANTSSNEGQVKSNNAKGLKGGSINVGQGDNGAL